MSLMRFTFPCTASEHVAPHHRYIDGRSHRSLNKLNHTLYSAPSSSSSLCCAHLSTTHHLQHTICLREGPNQDADQPPLNHDGASRSHAKLAPAVETLPRTVIRRATCIRNRGLAKSHAIYLHIYDIQPVWPSRPARSRCLSWNYNMHAQRSQVFHQEYCEQLWRELGRSEECHVHHISSTRSSDRSAGEGSDRERCQCGCWIGDKRE
jgi:hypothetical protein